LSRWSYRSLSILTVNRQARTAEGQQRGVGELLRRDALDPFHTPDPFIEGHQFGYSHALRGSDQVGIDGASSTFQIVGDIEPDFSPRHLDSSVIDDSPNSIGHGVYGTSIHSEEDKGKLGDGDIRQ
jgi:hypothetical protein